MCVDRAFSVLSELQLRLIAQAVSTVQIGVSQIRLDSVFRVIIAELRPQHLPKMCVRPANGVVWRQQPPTIVPQVPLTRVLAQHNSQIVSHARPVSYVLL